MKNTIVLLLTLACAFLTIFQGLIPTLPVDNADTIISAITIFLVTSLTAWKQALSVEISNKALYSTLAVAIVATLGGLNDLFPVFHFSEELSQWLRFGITFITMGINMLSKVIYSTPETKSIL